MSDDFSELRELFERVDVQDYLDECGVNYKRTMGSSGVQLNIETCPECHNSHYKLYLNAETGLGSCFAGACGKRFNLYSFVRALHGYQRHGDVMQDVQRHVRSRVFLPKKAKAKKTATRPPPVVALPHSFALPLDDGRNLLHLSERGITADMARHYDLRYSERGYYSYHDEYGNPQTQSYIQRVIIPVHDLQGEIVTFQGRDITGVSSRKYLFPPGLPGTQRYLYNSHRALGSSHIVICEGAFDVIAAQAALGTAAGVVGTFGKLIGMAADGGPSQLSQLKRLKDHGAEKLTILWDGELLPLQTAVQQGLELHKRGYSVRVGMLPRGCDPNEVEPEIVRQSVSEALSIDRLNAARALRIINARYAQLPASLVAH